MTGPKIGDRVHVEYDGVVLTDVTGGTAYMVDVDGLHGARALAHRRNITVITPPIKVGDIVTADNIDQLSAWSIISRPRNGLAIQNQRKGGWIMATSEDSSCDVPISRIVRWGDVVVVRVGDGA